MTNGTGLRKPYPLVALGVAFLMVVFAGGCGGNGDDEAQNPPAEETTEQAAAGQGSGPEETEADSSAAPVGEPVTVGNVRWMVQEVQQLDRIVSRVGSEEGNFVVVDLALENNSNQDVTLATPFVTLVDGEGNEVEADQDRNFTHLDPEKNMFVDQIEPGSTKAGRIIFSVEPDASELRLKVGEGRFASDETGYVDLNL